MKHLGQTHRVHIAVRTHDGLFVVSAVFDKPRNHAAQMTEQRIRDGQWCDLLTLNALLACLGIAQVSLDGGGIESDQLLDGRVRPERLELDPGYAADPFDRVLWPDGTVTGLDAVTADNHILFPGSFNPVHYGHDRMARLVRDTLGRQAVFQMSLAHPNKRVTIEELLARTAQLRFRHPVALLAGDGLYLQKARRFPGVPILIGADAVLEMFKDHHYGGFAGMMAAMDELLALGTVFHVNGRVCEGIYRELDTLPIIGRYAGMFRPISLRLDVSSSDRRASGAA